ncbi:MAG: hypothetical protein ACTSW7_00925 [Candidatus Thorarchaeota archaeon]|nr:hypothetical protein [Thermoplasmatales archaeon]
MDNNPIRPGSIDEMFGKVILWELEQVAENLKIDIKDVITAIKSGKLAFVQFPGETEKIALYHLYQYVEQYTYKYDELKQEMIQIMKGKENGTE